MGVPDEISDQMIESIRNFQVNQQNVLESEQKALDWAKRQTYLPFANMMTVAALLGIDSCPIEGFYIAKVEKLLAEENLLEDGHLAVSAMVAFGYRAANEPKYPRGRKNMKDIVQWIN